MGFVINKAVVSERAEGLFAFILTIFLPSCTNDPFPIFLKEREILMKEISCEILIVFLPFLALLFSSPVYWLAGLDRQLPSFAFFLYTANSVTVCFIVRHSVIAGVMGCFFLFSGFFIRKEGMLKRRKIHRRWIEYLRANRSHREKTHYKDRYIREEESRENGGF